uniref:J domain-containing protein n=1 Tax=Pyramimonas obovata TaxID=1411642 RepID=A0A7S0WWK1_9CHLO|mmetsp:Transcript_773/g.1629  ORF Transcript_773/g.1629 Transcript_773/m.1629 type:complete len:339 (+) Transcript_773:179-1195(+)|eukprot:CAMPEP_0118920950 /NCGR_PEP_ID=MMETSP1169-20130426/361_1 /TAXON_ID=36882 /ORGANISM="Pyramimonas obovata, Strain CCMP722" /LENGTH=338 /DNA_ID=CAMNT_0006861575 /DNA_START=178 /DNA_END=1194 /DNA_ORIENTATION=+
MGKDYYHDLGLTRSATDICIKKAYRKLSLKYHPDKDETEHAETVFAAVAEAYDVLSDPKNKGFYDLYGEEGLKQGVTDGKGGRKGGFYCFEKSPISVFCDFFGTNNPYQALNEISETFEAMTATPKLKIGKKKTHEVQVSLEDIYHGTIMKVDHIKKVLTADKRVEKHTRTLTMDFKPGTPDRTLYVFDKEGDEAPNVEPGPVVYSLTTAKHDTFSRKGSDLVYVAKIPLVKALTGTTLNIKMLDGRMLSVPVTDIMKTGTTKVVVGEGLPKPEGGFGDLMIVFDLIFPSTLNDDQRMIISAGFYLPKQQTKEQVLCVRAFRKGFMDTLKGWASGFKL